jgi:hypothetical protein
MTAWLRIRFKLVTELGTFSGPDYRCKYMYVCVDILWMSRMPSMAADDRVVRSALD